MTLFGAYYQWIPEGDPNDVGARELNDRRGLFPVLDFTPKGIIHVGMFDAWEAHHFVKACGNNVVWFEANPETYKQYKHIPEQYGQFVVNFAAWKEEGILRFSNQRDQSHITEDGEFEVYAKPVDWVLDAYPDRPFDFLNIDAEGAEIEVLQGAKLLLENHIQYVLIEVDPYVSGPDVDEFLANYGFEMLHQSTIFRQPSGHYADRIYKKVR